MSCFAGSYFLNCKRENQRTFFISKFPVLPYPLPISAAPVVLAWFLLSSSAEQYHSSRIISILVSDTEATETIYFRLFLFLYCEDPTRGCPSGTFNTPLLDTSLKTSPFIVSFFKARSPFLTLKARLRQLYGHITIKRKWPLVNPIFHQRGQVQWIDKSITTNVNTAPGTLLGLKKSSAIQMQADAEVVETRSISLTPRQNSSADTHWYINKTSKGTTSFY